MTATPALEVRKVGRSFAICAGVSVLSRFRAEACAVAELEARKAFYAYWAGSASVSAENSPAVVVHV
jgi:hypothetical protein